MRPITKIGSLESTVAVKTKRPELEEHATISVIERYEHAPDECTIFPVKMLDSDSSQTEWISAQEGSFISIDFIR